MTKNITNWRVLFYTLACFPWAFAVTIILFYLKSEIELGNSPLYPQIDPVSLSSYHEFEPYIHLTFSLWIYTFLGWLVVLILYIYSIKNKIDWMPVIVSSIGHFIALVLMFSTIFEW